MTPAEFKRLREKDLGLTQAAMAEELGVHRVTIAKWEAEDRGIPEPVARFVRQIRNNRLGRDLLDMRKALESGKGVLSFESVCPRIERVLGTNGLHHVKELRRGDTRTARGRARLREEITMILDKLLRLEA
jgi:transcriptional regulator with XRE-family HTH domain